MDEAAAEAELTAVARIGGQLLLSGETAYPPRMRHIPDPPPLLRWRLYRRC